jgi:hypothetical protein
MKIARVFQTGVRRFTPSLLRVCCKRARPDICPAIVYLKTRVTCSTESDWKRLTRLMKYLKQTANDRLTLRADGTGELKWHVDAAFAVQPNFRSNL